MKIEKSKLSKALKQIGIFIKKNSPDHNASLVHFKNKNGKATIFATDLASAGRVYFETGFDEPFEFCVDYSQLLQTTRIRSKEINAEIITTDDVESKKAVLFSDDSSKFLCALRDTAELDEIEQKAVIPSGDALVLTGKDFKEGIKEGGYARNEKATDKAFALGVNVSCDEDGTLEIASLDNKRIACWKKKLDANFAKMSGMLGPRALQAIGLFDDDEEIRVYIDNTKIVLVSPTYEAYTTRLQCNFPNFKPFFEKEVLSVYEVTKSEVNESLAIAVSDAFMSDSLDLSFNGEVAKLLSTNAKGEKVEDGFGCRKISGKDENVSLCAKYFSDVFHFVGGEKISFEFREMGNGAEMVSYSAEDGSYGLIAPRQK